MPRNTNVRSKADDPIKASPSQFQRETLQPDLPITGSCLVCLFVINCKTNCESQIFPSLEDKLIKELTRGHNGDNEYIVGCLVYYLASCVLLDAKEIHSDFSKLNLILRILFLFLINWVELQNDTQRRYCCNG